MGFLKSAWAVARPLFVILALGVLVRLAVSQFVKPADDLLKKVEG